MHRCDELAAMPVVLGAGLLNCAGWLHSCESIQAWRTLLLRRGWLLLRLSLLLSLRMPRRRRAGQGLPLGLPLGMLRLLLLQRWLGAGTLHSHR
jgi:hypothetical protein